MLTLPDGSASTMTIQVGQTPRARCFYGVANRCRPQPGRTPDRIDRFCRDKSRLPVLTEDTYYWFDLVGLSVYDPAGFLLGRLDEVIPTPGNDVYVVKGNVEGQPRELLIPAIGDVVLSIDMAGKTMVVELPEGL
jgi:hypothetical protein